MSDWLGWVLGWRFAEEARTTTVTINTSPLGGRLLRVLDTVGLSQNVTTHLKVSVTPAGTHRAHSITGSTKVL